MRLRIGSKVARTSQILAVGVLALVLGIWPLRVLLGESKPIVPVAVTDVQAVPGPIDPASSMTPKSQPKTGTVVFLTTPALLQTEHDRKLGLPRPASFQSLAITGSRHDGPQGLMASVSLIHTQIGSQQRLLGAKPSGTA